MKGSIPIPTQLIGKWRENGIASFAARARPLRVYLILFAVGLALLMPSGYFLSRMAALERNQIERGVLQAADSLSWDIDRELDRAIVTLETLSTSEALASGEFDKFHAHATRALRGTYRAILLIDARSFQQLLNTRVPFGTPLPKTALTEVAREVMRKREP